MTATPSTWSVTAQVPRTTIAANGQPTEGVEISFVTGAGHSGTVFVPQTQYRPDRVKAVIAAAAQNMDAVGALTHDTEV